MSFFEVRKFYNVGKLFFFFFFVITLMRKQHKTFLICVVKLMQTLLNSFWKYTWEHIRLLKIQGSDILNNISTSRNRQMRWTPLPDKNNLNSIHRQIIFALQYILIGSIENHSVPIQHSRIIRKSLRTYTTFKNNNLKSTTYVQSIRYI